MAGTIVNRVNVPGVPSGDLSISKPLSLSALSVHDRSIWESETAVADKPVGGSGGSVGGSPEISCSIKALIA